MSYQHYNELRSQLFDERNPIQDFMPMGDDGPEKAREINVQEIVVDTENRTLTWEGDVTNICGSFYWHAFEHISNEY